MHPSPMPRFNSFTPDLLINLLLEPCISKLSKESMFIVHNSFNEQKSSFDFKKGTYDAEK